MSSQNNEFEIPFTLSRRGKKQEFGTKSIGRRIGSLAASRMIDRPSIGGKRRSGRGLGIPDGDLNPLTRVDKNRDGTLFDGWPGWEQPDPTPNSPGSINNPLSLSSGAKEKPSFPRKPTYGPFIGSAEKKFGKAKTWEEFKEIYDDTEVIFFDYETTGLVFDEFREPSSNGLPVQFGAVKMKGGKEISRLNIFMNPNEPLGDWSRNNLKDKDGNPLTDVWLATQPSIADAHKALVEFAGEDAIFGVQNAAFDKDVLEKTLSDAGIDWRPGGYLDTKDIADMTLPKWSEDNQDGPFIVAPDGSKKASNGLAAITKYLEVDLGEKHHTADADAQATGLVMSAIINGAIERDWPTNLLDSNKRKNKLKANNDKFESEVKKFREAKASFVKSVKEKESPSLSSGSRERPTIKLSKTVKRPTISFEKNQRDLLKKHRSKDYKYGDESVLGGTINASKNTWLKGLTGKQIANLIVPDSEESHFRMWVDDIAPGAYEMPNMNAAFRKYYDEMLTNSPWDGVDYSPESVTASREAVQALLDSSPAVRWAFENHGAPSIGVMSIDSVNYYESIPSVKEKLDELKEKRGVAKRPFVRARLSPATNRLSFNRRALVDREDSSSDKKTELLWSDTHMPLQSDTHIDKSIAGTMVHEWGHWLNFRAVKDTENTKKNRSNFFGSGDINDDNYINALGLAEYYKQTEKDQALMDLWDNEIPIDETKDVPRVITSYGHVNPAETFAEGMVAYLHPNKEVREKAINEKLRKDIESFLGDGTEKRPWDEHEALDVALSSGRTKEQKLKRRTANTSASEQAFSRDKNRSSNRTSTSYEGGLDRDLMSAAEYGDNSISLASGAKYEQILRRQPSPSPKQVESSNNFKDLIRMSELRTADEYVVTGQDVFGDDEEELLESEDRINFKNDIKNNLETLFSNEIQLDKPLIIQSSSGELINLGDKIKVTANVRSVQVNNLTEQDIAEQAAEMSELFFDGKKPVTLITIGFKITPADEVATQKFIQSGVPTDLIEVDDPKSSIALAAATRQIVSDGDKIFIGHETIFVGKEARRFGIASAVNARNESIYAELGIDSIFTMAQSSTSDQQGVTHWARNGFTWMGEPSKQKFIKVIDDAISNNPELFSPEEIERISSLYKKQGDKFKSSASAEELIDFAAADEIFKNADEGQGATIFFKREVAKPSRISAIKNRAKRRIDSKRTKQQITSPSLSSGAGFKTKLNIERFGDNKQYAEVRSFEVNGKKFNISKGGDSPGRDMYNGYMAAFDNGKNIGYIDYNLDQAQKKATVAMISVDEEYRRQGIAEALLDSFLTENPGYEVSPGYTTEEGEKWWRSVTGGDGPITSPSVNKDSASPSLASGADNDYRMLHGAPGRGSGAPLHDLTSLEYAVYPEDVYTSDAIKYYGVGSDNLDMMAFNLIRRFKGKPNAEVTIYRAVPRSTASQIDKLEKQLARYMRRGRLPDGVDRGIEPHIWSESVRNEIERLKKLPPNNININNGDWVTPFRQYAVDHGNGALNGDYEIVKKRVKAKHVYTAGDSWLEWGYDDSKGSLSLSSGAQPNINFTDAEKREMISIASQRSDNFSRSVVAQHNRNGRLSNKQWLALNRITLRGGPSLSSGALVEDSSIQERVLKSFSKASPADNPSTPLNERLLTKLTSGILKKDGSPLVMNDILNFLTDMATREEFGKPHPGFNRVEEKLLPIESLMELFKDLGLSRIDVPGSKTKKILGPVVPELADLAGDEQWLQDARNYVLPPLETWARAAAKTIMARQKFIEDVGESIESFSQRKFVKEKFERGDYLVLRGPKGERLASIEISKLQQGDLSKLTYSDLGAIMFDYSQKVPGVPFMTLVKSHMYPDDPLKTILADSHVISAQGSADLGGANMAESLENAKLTPLSSYDFGGSPAAMRVQEMFERAYANVAHHDEFAKRYAIRVRTLLMEAGLDPDRPDVKRALTKGWNQIPDTTEEPAENGGRFISAALLVRNLIAGLYRPSWDNSGETYVTPHEFMHLITGQGFTRHGEMASNIGWLGAFGEDVWPTVANLIKAQERFFDMQKEDSQNGDIVEANEQFRIMVLNEIREILGGDGDDYGRTSQKLLEDLYKSGGVLATAKQDGLFEGFKWVNQLLPLDAEDLGWGSGPNPTDNSQIPIKEQDK